MTRERTPPVRRCDPLRVTLFANLGNDPATKTIRAVPQVAIPTPPPSVRSNPKALKLSALYFKTHIPCYSDLTADLNDMVKKDFNWDPAT